MRPANKPSHSASSANEKQRRNIALNNVHGTRKTPNLIKHVRVHGMRDANDQQSHDLSPRMTARAGKPSHQG